MKKVIAVSSLEKVFPDSVSIAEINGFSMLKNEIKSFQLVFHAVKGERVELSVKSPLADNLKFSYVKMINGGYSVPNTADDFYIGKRDAYPDLLLPVDKCFTAEYDGLNTLWVQISGDSLPSGEFEICISFGGDECTVTVQIIDALLPKQELIYTNWFHTDCLMSYYGFEAFSDEYWRVTENFLRRAVEYGMNCVLTPLFTPPLDTKIGGERPTVQLVDVRVIGENQYEFSFEKLDKWLEICDRCNIEYYEMSHFFTQWGARHAPKIVADVNGKQKRIFGWDTLATGKNYKLFLKQFAQAFTAYINKKGIREKCFLHVSDEPSAGMLHAYRGASKIIHNNFKGFKVIDAMSSYFIYRFAKIQTPIPANDFVQNFIGRVPELWTYYCSSQNHNYVSNRLFAMPSQRNRVIGLQLFKFDVKGFLHWGYNFYYTQYSKREVDPFTETDAGGKFPSGDSYVVYPGEKGEPLDSLRLYVFYDALQDLRALKLLESKIGKEKALSIVEQGLDNPLTFSEYPHDAKWLEDVREKINKAIMEN